MPKDAQQQITVCFSSKQSFFAGLVTAPLLALASTLVTFPLFRDARALLVSFIILPILSILIGLVVHGHCYVFDGSRGQVTLYPRWFLRRGSRQLMSAPFQKIASLEWKPHSEIGGDAGELAMVLEDGRQFWITGNWDKAKQVIRLVEKQSVV